MRPRIWCSCARAQPVGVLDDEGVHVGDIDARLDDGGADQYLYLAVGHLLHHPAQLLLRHLAVGYGEAHILPSHWRSRPAVDSMFSTRLCR